MDEKKADIVKRLTGAILKGHDPEMVILFGSTARGDADEFSDIDILVIMDDDNPDATAQKIMADTDQVDTEKDIKVITPDEYYTQKDIPGTILFPILNEGTVVYKKTTFNTEIIPIKTYEERKRDIIKKEFIEQAFDFLEQAAAALENNSMFRFRDYTRFAVIRALKAVFVLNDIHPPRETDLDLLMEMIDKLHPVVKELKPLIIRLKDFYPYVDGNVHFDPGEMLGNANDIVCGIKAVVI
ncbi:nucleotidyltransferase domain-containing protein [Thermodesulfobacteriota bacterium]